jgi:hypothetical protein
MPIPFFWNNMPIPIYIYCTVIKLNYASFYQTKLNVIYDILKDPFHNKSQDQLLKYARVYSLVHFLYEQVYVTLSRFYI